MGSNGKKKTTMAKLNRETKLRERKWEKQARKDARKREAAEIAALPPEERAKLEAAALAEQREINAA